MSEYYGSSGRQSSKSRYSAVVPGAKWHPVLGRFVQEGELRVAKPKVRYYPDPETENWWDLPCGSREGSTPVSRVKTNGELIVVSLPESCRGKKLLHLCYRMLEFSDGPRQTAELIMKAMEHDKVRVKYV